MIGELHWAELGPRLSSVKSLGGGGEAKERGYKANTSDGLDRVRVIIVVDNWRCRCLLGLSGKYSTVQ